MSRIIKNFPKEELIELVTESESDNLTTVINDILETTRWSIIHRLVFQDKQSGGYFETFYNTGATEYQDESPFEYEDDEITCSEVVPTQVNITKYVPKYIPKWG